MNDQEFNDFVAAQLELMKKFNLSEVHVERMGPVEGTVLCKMIESPGGGTVKRTEIHIAGRIAK